MSVQRTYPNISAPQGQEPAPSSPIDGERILPREIWFPGELREVRPADRRVACSLNKAAIGTDLDATSPDATVINVNELILAFWQHAKQRYVKNGEPTSEIRSFKTALRPVRRALRPGAGHELRPAGLGRLPPEADRSRNLPQADQPARRPYPPHVQVGGGPRDGARDRVAGSLCRRGPADRRGDRKATRLRRFRTNASPPSSTSSRRRFGPWSICRFGRHAVLARRASCGPSTSTCRAKSGNKEATI